MTGLLQFIAQAFVSGFWQGAVLVAAVAAVLRCLPRLAPATRFAVWTATFLAIATVPLLHLPTHAPAQASPALHLGLGWALLIAACWAILLTLRLTRLAIHAQHLRRIWNNAAQIAVEAEIQSILDTTGRHPALCTSPDVDAPSVIGFLAPRLLVPETLLPSLTNSELLQIVQHECEHLRRRDDWINLLQKLALAFFPLNPALFVIDRRLGLERELACDAAVVRASSTPFAYANALTRLAEHRILLRPLALALSAWSRQSELARRVHRLLRPTGTMSPLQARCVIAALGVALTGGAFELTQSPNLISFAPAIAAPVAETFPVSLPTEHVRAVPVVYRPALLPSNEYTSARNTRVRLRKSRPTPPLNQSSEAHVPQPHFRVVLTSASSQPAPDSERVIQAVWTDLSPTYAAIQTANGWLIIQL